MFKNLLYLAVFTTVVVASWIGFEVYNSTVTSTISEDKNIIITPIPQSFDEETIFSIKNKKLINANLSDQKASGSAVTTQPVTTNSTTSATPTTPISPTILPVPEI